MQHQLPKLPYPLDALEPHISKETLDYHHGKHHQSYVNNLNNLIAGTPYENMSLEEIIQESDGSIFNNAAQIWNHSFYFQCLSPKKSVPSANLKLSIEKSFGSHEEFVKEFSQSAIKTFGSGWAWLVQNDDLSLSIVTTSNAQTPLKDNHNVLLTCDVWEHAYYIDFRNSRPNYIKAFWKLVNWDFVSSNFK